MILLLVDAETGFIFMPLNPGEGWGSMEDVIEVDEGPIPQPHRDNIIAQLAVPRDKRESGVPGNAYNAIVPQEVKDRSAARMNNRRNPKGPPKHAHYFYDEVQDIAVDGKGIPVLEARFGDAPSTVDDLHGPITAAVARSMIINPPV